MSHDGVKMGFNEHSDLGEDDGRIESTIKV